MIILFVCFAKSIEQRTNKTTELSYAFISLYANIFSIFLLGGGNQLIINSLELRIKSKKFTVGSLQFAN